MLLVAVSGGVDSMTLAEKVRQEGGPFAIAHCNFSLRGAESDADEALVLSWARSHDIPYHVKRFDTQAFAASEGISIEMAARRLRYHWFGQLCREFGYQGVAVAHNANDNAETLILNLLRGTGLKGLTGMKAQGFIPDPEFGDIPLLRPLLGMTREEILAFAREHQLPWREDSTNIQNDYKRNKIRNLAFPVFREINPSFIQTLNRNMERIAGELQQLAEGGPGPISDGGPGPRSFDFNLSFEDWDGSEPVKQPQGVLILDADKLALLPAEGREAQEAEIEAAIGPWESGDWIKPLGAPGRKKMQDWFTDHHISADEKPFVPLLRSPGNRHHILAVIPYCIDHSVRVTQSTRRILRIRCD